MPEKLLVRKHGFEFGGPYNRHTPTETFQSPTCFMQIGAQRVAYLTNNNEYAHAVVVHGVVVSREYTEGNFTYVDVEPIRDIVLKRKVERALEAEAKLFGHEAKFHFC